jgi:cellulose biosynthesis protein BcsQ
MNDWNITTQLEAAADTVTVMLAGPQDRTSMWLGMLSMDTRFRVTMMAATPEDLRSKIITPAEIILIDAAIFTSGEHCLGEISRIKSTALYIILPQLPPQEAKEIEAALKELHPVRGVYHVDVHLASLLETMYGDARTLRRTQRTQPGMAWNGNGSGQGSDAGQPVSTRIIAVWNQMGGVGKTTISSNLAVEASRRGYPTLYIGLGAPDDMPLIMGLKRQPNITHWQSNPTLEGLKLAIQKVGTLDVLGGFPDVLSEAQAMNLPNDHPGSVKSLVDVAIRGGYAVIVIDAPPTALAAAAMMASNTLVITARSDNGGIYRTVEAYRTVAERLAGMHNIPTNRIYLALNRIEPQQADASTWHREASQRLGRAFPPIIAAIPHIAAVNQAQNERRIPLNSSEEFAEALKPLVDALFTSNGNSKVASANGKTIKFGPIKVRV